MKYAVGLDVSFRSPGMCIYDVRNDMWHLFGFAQLLREVGFRHRERNVTIELLPIIPHADVHAHLHVEAHFFAVLNRLITKEDRDDTKVAIEMYVRVPGHENDDWKLHEIGGIIKRQLEVSGFHDVHSVYPATWQSHFLIKTKLDAVHVISKIGPMIDVLMLLGYDELKLPVDKKGRKVVPTPVQDLADSTGLAMYLFLPKCKKPKLPPRKKVKKEPPKPRVLPKEFVRNSVCADVFQTDDDTSFLSSI